MDALDRIVEIQMEHFRQSLEGMRISRATYWGDLPEDVSAKVLSQHERKCLSCKQSFYGSTQRIECNACAPTPPEQDQ